MTTRRTQRERTAESGRRLLDAAVALFSQQGYEGTTAAQIAVHAGFSRSMVNARYGTKDALLDELLRTRYEDRVLASTAPDLSGLETVLAAYDGLIDLAAEDPLLLRAMFVLNLEAAGNAQTLRPRITDWLRRLEGRLVAALDDGVRDGSVRPDVEPKAAARHVLQVTIGAAYTWIVLPSPTDLPAELRRLRDDARRAFGAGR